MKTYESPAQFVIRKFGSMAETGRAIGRTRQAVSKWLVPKHRGGSDGRVPGFLHRRIISVAKRRGLNITAFELIHGKGSYK